MQPHLGTLNLVHSLNFFLFRQCDPHLPLFWFFQRKTHSEKSTFKRENFLNEQFSSKWVPDPQSTNILQQ